jgi:hypothetical protein
MLHFHPRDIASGVRINRIITAASMGFALLTTIGCSGQVSMVPNSDKSLRKTPAQFAADAVARHPFPSDLVEAGDANGQARVDYQFDTVQVVNLSDEDWTNVDVWADRTHVVNVPTLAGGGKRATTLHFQMMFDAQGNHYPINNYAAERQIRRLEVVRDGKVYQIPLNLAH